MVVGKETDSRIISVWYSSVVREVDVIITFIVVTISVVFSGVYSGILEF